MNTKLMFSSASDRWATPRKSSVSMHSVSGTGATVCRWPSGKWKALTMTVSLRCAGRHGGSHGPGDSPRYRPRAMPDNKSYS